MPWERSVTLGLALMLAWPGATRAQIVTDGSDAAIGVERSQAVLALVARMPLSAEARVTGLHEGRTGGLCSSVEVKNRMGTYTGPRPFVADLPTAFAGKLPEGPELRSPASMAAFRDMERAKTLFAANCTLP